MAMKKYADGEGKLDVVFEGREASVVHDHLVRTGKALSDFNEGEREALERELAELRREEEAQKEAERTEADERPKRSRKADSDEKR